MSVTQKDGQPHVALVGDVIDMLDRMFVNHLRDVEFLVEKSQEIGGNVEVSFDLSAEEYFAIASIGNKLRDKMGRHNEYRWDFLMTMIYQDLFVDENGIDSRVAKEHDERNENKHV